jgi:hypothetical protein
MHYSLLICFIGQAEEIYIKYTSESTFMLFVVTIPQQDTLQKTEPFP